jgi:hypothetical protein
LWRNDWLPVWRPADGAAVPGILEYVPYRKRDLTAERESIHRPYLAAEYLEQEQLDAEDVLAWNAAQPWSDGVAGMKGINAKSITWVNSPRCPGANTPGAVRTVRVMTELLVQRDSRRSSCSVAR